MRRLTVRLRATPRQAADCKRPEDLLRVRKAWGPLYSLKGIIKSILGNLRPAPEPTFLSLRKDLAEYDIGDWTFGQLEVRTWDQGGHLRIGKFCGIARGVAIYLGGEHRIDWLTSYPFTSLFRVQKEFPGYPKLKGDVKIGNDVWIGENAIIMSGVEIGDGAVIGTGCVVRRDVPPYAICAGNPSRVSGFRFEKEQIEALRKIAWWDWQIDKIKEAWPLLLSPDIDRFLEEYGKDMAGSAVPNQEDKESRTEGSSED